MLLLLFSDIYLLYIKERKKLDVDVCLGERETSFGCRREKREKRSSFYKTQTKKEEIIVSFSRGGDAAI